MIYLIIAFYQSEKSAKQMKRAIDLFIAKGYFTSQIQIFVLLSYFVISQYYFPAKTSKTESDLWRKYYNQEASVWNCIQCSFYSFTSKQNNWKTQLQVTKKIFLLIFQKEHL